MPDSQLPGQRWFFWLRNPTLGVGAITGVYLSVILGAWLVVANRVPWTANFALFRNMVAGGALLLVMLIPAACYLHSPKRLFAAGLTAWVLLTCTYLAMEQFFLRLQSRMGALHVFAIGALAYGCFAVVAWVAGLALAARHHPIAPARRRSY